MAADEEAAISLERGRAWLEQVLHLMSVSVAVRCENDMLEIDAADLLDAEKAVLIGDAGATLDALQYLANTLLNLERPQPSQRAYTIELDGYRSRRQAELEQMTDAAVAQVRKDRREWEMKSLSAAERRQIHMLLKTDAYADIETFSRGKEPHRYLVIRLADSSPT